MSNKKKDYSGHLKNRIMNEKQPADYMQEDAFKAAVLPMLEQAYKQGYEDGQRDALVRDLRNRDSQIDGE